MNLTAQKIEALCMALRTWSLGGSDGLSADVAERVAELVQEYIDSLTNHTTVGSITHYQTYDVIVDYTIKYHPSIAESLQGIVYRMIDYAERMKAPCRASWGGIPLIATPLDTVSTVIARWEIARAEGSVVPPTPASQKPLQRRTAVGVPQTA